MKNENKKLSGERSELKKYKKLYEKLLPKSRAMRRVLKDYYLSGQMNQLAIE